MYYLSVNGTFDKETKNEYELNKFFNVLNQLEGVLPNRLHDWSELYRLMFVFPEFKKRITTLPAEASSFMAGRKRFDCKVFINNIC